MCASLEAQWWIICLPMQQTRVRSPVQEDPTCHKATETVNHKYWACALGPGSHKTAAPTSCNSSSVFAPQEKPPHWEAVCIRNTVAPSSLQPERSPPSNKDPAKPRINKSTFKRLAKSIKCWKKNDVSEHVFVCVCVCGERERWVSLLYSRNYHNRLSVQFSHSVLPDSLWPEGLQHAKLPCPSPTPRVYSNSWSWSQWCHPTISSSVIPFSSHLQSFPASGSFPVSKLFTSGGQRIGVSTSVLPMNIQDWSPLGWTDWISLQSKEFSRVFSNTTVQKHQFFSTQLSL